MFFGSGLFKRENLTKRWFDQGTGWPQRMAAAQPPTQNFPKIDLPKNGVHPKPSAESFFHSLNIIVLKNIQWLLIQMVSRIKSKFFGKARQVLHDSVPTSPFWPYHLFFPTCDLYASPKATCHLPQMWHAHPPSQFLQPECSPPCHHLCPPKNHIFSGHALFLGLYFKLILIIMHLFLTLDYKPLMDRSFLIHLHIHKIYIYLFNKCILNYMHAM